MLMRHIYIYISYNYMNQIGKKIKPPAPLSVKKKKKKKLSMKIAKGKNFIINAMRIK